jgi:serine/threonine kinase PknH
MAESLTGHEINGYKIGPILGSGGMGEVYQAVASETKAEVAMKFLRRDLFADTKIEARFAREISIMKSLDHPNIMPVYDSGVYEGGLYYTMRLIRGQTLSTLLRRRKLSPIELYPILEQLVKALTYGHERNLIHRDIKPDNVFVERKPETNQLIIILGDFGLGKRVGTDQTLTEADAVLGTPQYMAPEAVLGNPITFKSDLYALGIMMYEILSGGLPFNEESGHLTAMSHVTKPIKPIVSFREDFPEVLDTVILRALSKTPDDRYDSASQMLEVYVNAMKELSDEQRKTAYSSS